MKKERNLLNTQLYCIKDIFMFSTHVLCVCTEVMSLWIFHTMSCELKNDGHLEFIDLLPLLFTLIKFNLLVFKIF